MSSRVAWMESWHADRVKVGQYLASITGAIEQLGERGTRTTRRGLGATMQLLVEYFNLFNGLSGMTHLTN